VWNHPGASRREERESGKGAVLMLGGDVWLVDLDGGFGMKDGENDVFDVITFDWE